MEGFAYLLRLSGCQHYIFDTKTATDKEKVFNQILPLIANNVAANTEYIICGYILFAIRIYSNSVHCLSNVIKMDQPCFTKLCWPGNPHQMSSCTFVPSVRVKPNISRCQRHGLLVMRNPHM